MVIDTSAIVAIALNEPEAPDFERRIANDPVRLISAATVLEAAMVIETRLGEAGGSELDLWRTRPTSRSSRSSATMPIRPAAPGAALARAATLPASILAIVSFTRWPR